MLSVQKALFPLEGPFPEFRGRVLGWCLEDLPAGLSLWREPTANGKGCAELGLVGENVGCVLPGQGDTEENWKDAAALLLASWTALDLPDCAKPSWSSLLAGTQTGCARQGDTRDQ